MLRPNLPSRLRLNHQGKFSSIKDESSFDENLLFSLQDFIDIKLQIFQLINGHHSSFFFVENHLKLICRNTRSMLNAHTSCSLSN